ncbi:MAG: gliding motility-associated C-terminal domain-containing protein, partial [Saprospiraceae bacterium]|nr:gliding motility-associated C-terminal domain-containing protein [Saprospiraceae bacterium]
TIICNGELAQLEFVPTGGLLDYNYTWNSAALGNASIIDQVPSGAYSITVSDMNGCTFDSSFTIDEPTPITYDLQSTNISCIGLESGDITIENIQGGTSPYSVLIDNVIINEFFINSLSEGQYTIEILDDNGCISISNQVNITGSTSVTLADYTLTHNITEGNSVLLDGEFFENNLSFEWSPNSTLSCIDCMEPIASPSTTTIYELTVTNEDGCEQIINITVIVSPNVIIQVFPNIFSPNGDGSNDEFLLTFDNELTTKIELIVFDRWGNQLHNSISSDGTIMWNGSSNGRDLNPGVYIYQLTIDYIDGTSETIVNDLTLIK